MLSGIIIFNLSALRALHFLLKIVGHAKIHPWQNSKTAILWTSTNGLKDELIRLLVKKMEV
jgi:hypothetical protein